MKRKALNADFFYKHILFADIIPNTVCVVIKLLNQLLLLSLQPVL